jgi:hypothetical protein
MIFRLPEKSGPAVRVLEGATHRPEFGLGRSKRTLEGGPECTDCCFGRSRRLLAELATYGLDSFTPAPHFDQEGAL